MPEADVDREARTEEPTPRRIEEARERGQVARSQEVVSVLVTLAVLLMVWILAPMLYSMFAEVTQWSFEAFNRPVPEDSSSGAVVVVELGWRAMAMLAPFFGVAIAIGVLANIMQFGLIFSTTPVTPDINRINPAQGLTRFLSVRTAEHLVLAIGKVILAGIVIYLFVKFRGPKLAALIDGTVAGGFVAILREVMFLGFALLLMFALLAVADLVFQYYQYHVDLRMTRQELKEELRRMEGDPAIRARRRAVMRRLLFNRMFAQVPESDVVVTNPTEYAVALRYKAGMDGAPVVVAKGRLKVAERIRDLAIAHGIPIVERPVLARGLYFAVEIGREIPAEFYQMVAEVLAFVYRMRQPGKVSA